MSQEARNPDGKERLVCKRDMESLGLKEEDVLGRTMRKRNIHAERVMLILSSKCDTLPGRVEACRLYRIVFIQLHLTWIFTVI